MILCSAFLSDACSQTGSSSLPGLAGLVKDLLEEQQKKLKKFWPCFKGVLSGIKMVFINADRCGYGSAWDSSTSSPIDLMQEMRDMFKSRKWRVTQILTHISDKMIESPFSYMYPKGHLAFTLARMAEALHAMTNDELRKMLGRKCFNRLSKRCI